MIIIRENITTSDIMTLFSANNTELLSKWKCHENSFKPIIDSTTGDDLRKVLNANLRSDVVRFGQTGKEFAEAVNASYQRRISRFQDLLIENVFKTDGSAEPTALTTDDGSRLDVWFTTAYTYSLDGINFSVPVPINYHQPQGASYNDIMCLNFFRHDGKVYSTTVAAEVGGWLLWESTDNVNFTFVKVLFTPTNGVNNYGNTFLFENNGMWYFLYEAAGNMSHGNGYQIYLATSNSLTGVYTNVKDTPIIQELLYDGVGNPEIVKVGNSIYKCDGYFYMYYHFRNTSPGRAIYRAKSLNMIDWEIEGAMLDTRIPTTKPEWSNGDQCVCEFKGHSYLFYTNNANQYITGDPGVTTHIDMCVDFRPMSEMLRLYP